MNPALEKLGQLALKYAFGLAESPDRKKLSDAMEKDKIFYAKLSAEKKTIY